MKYLEYQYQQLDGTIRCYRILDWDETSLNWSFKEQLDESLGLKLPTAIQVSKENFLKICSKAVYDEISCT